MNTSSAQEREFANSTQADFAGALDSYQIAWHYKPRTFAIEWDDDGNFVDSLTPDFYLPEYDQYVELASPEYRFAEKKRCVLLLRRHHPEIRITLISPPEVDSLVERLILLGGRVHADLSHLWTPPQEATRACL